MNSYFRLQAARRALRAASHKYTNTKKTALNKPNYDAAVEALEKAALTFALCAAEHGTRTGIASPMLGEEEWKVYQDAINPEPEDDDAKSRG